MAVLILAFWSVVAVVVVMVVRFVRHRPPRPGSDAVDRVVRAACRDLDAELEDLLRRKGRRPRER